jgi:alkylation response protein AidB-like acyl-CoA dehydrogenase
MMREAVSLMGGYGITEDCPGFLGQKWMDAQLEATYEGPEAVQRRQLSVTMVNEVFLAQFERWIAEIRKIASTRPATGACTLATGMSLWLWTLNHLQKTTDPEGGKLYHSSRHAVTFAMADALCWLLAARSFLLDVLELEEKGPSNPILAEGMTGLSAFYTDLCHVQCARAAGEVGRIAAELVFGYRAHLDWANDPEACYHAEDLVALEGIIPGLASTATDVVQRDGGHPEKAGPCSRFEGVEQFVRLRAKLDGCLSGARLAKDRAAEALTKIMIPEALDYPA